MKFNIEPLKGFPLSNDQKETLLCLIKKMCDENNSSKPAQTNEPIQITVYPNSNSSYEWFVSTKFGTTLDQHISIGEDRVLSLYINNDELFEYVEKNILNCGFELIITFDADGNSWCRTNQYRVTYNIQDGVLDKYNCRVYFELKIDSIVLNVEISIQKR